MDTLQPDLSPLSPWLTCLLDVQTFTWQVGKLPSLPFALKFSPGGSRWVGAALSFPVVETKTLQSFWLPLPPTSDLAHQGILPSLP